MNGLYGMPETAIEDADHTTSDDLTSKINYIEKAQENILGFFNYASTFCLSSLFLESFLAKSKAT